MKKIYAFGIYSLLVIILCGSSLTTKAQITTVAGRPTYLGDGGPATNAGLYGAYTLARDTTGNLYIATTADNRVRKVDAVTKIITTVAGTGVSGYSGDGGLATAANLNFTGVGSPGLAVDKNGNVYIADYNNNRIRKIDVATQKIGTIAGNNTNGGYSGDGGLATLASLSGPEGIALDTSGNIYFVDNGNNVVRRIDAVTLKITTVVGDGSGITGYAGDGGLATAATLNSPERIAIDASNNIYIADEYNFVVRKVDANTKIISTVAGSGVQGFSGDGGLALNAAINNIVGITIDTAGNIFIADQGNNRVREITAADKKITTVAGTGALYYAGDGVLANNAAVGKPTDVLIDKAGNLLIADFANNRIRKVDAASKIISTMAGDGTDGFTGAPTALQAQLAPQAVTFNTINGDMLIADGFYYDVRAVNIANSSIIYAGKPSPDPAFASKGYAGNGLNATFPQVLLNAPVGVAVDASSNVYIADVFNHVVRVINYNSKTINNYAGNATPGYAGDGAAATSASLNTPWGIALDKKGNLYIADALNNRIRKVDATTQKISTVAGVGAAGSEGDNGPATSAQLNLPYAVATDTAGNVFIVDRGNKSIRKVTASTGLISTILSNGHVFSGIATDAAGNIFVSDSTDNTIVRIDRTNFTNQIVAGNGTAGYSGDNGAAKAAQLNNPKGLYINSQGYIYVADLGNGVIRKIIMGALPVVLQNFSAEKNKNTVFLQWTTATETKNDHFEIERKDNAGTGWQLIGSLPGQGNSSTLNNYTFTDITPANGNNFYRLKQVDADGNFTFSEVRMVNIPIASWSVKTYPNPVTNNLHIDFTNDKTEAATIIIYNTAGNIVHTEQMPLVQGFNHITITHVQTLPKGLYFVKLITKINNFGTKFIKLGK